jgi:hypothetical protein
MSERPLPPCEAVIQFLPVIDSKVPVPAGDGNQNQTFAAIAGQPKAVALLLSEKTENKARERFCLVS